jgi:hypothetical protein
LEGWGIYESGFTVSWDVAKRLGCEVRFEKKAMEDRLIVLEKGELIITLISLVDMGVLVGSGTPHPIVQTLEYIFHLVGYIRSGREEYCLLSFVSALSIRNICFRRPHYGKIEILYLPVLRFHS